MTCGYEPAPRAASSIIRRQHHSKRPTTAEEKALPLHSSRVAPIRLLQALERMLPEKRERFRKVWNGVIDPATTGMQPCAHEPDRSLFFSAEDAAVLERDSIVLRVDEQVRTSRPTRGCVTAFTVVELAKGRRRAIHWPEEQNAASERVYTPDVPLQHISAYLDDVHTECGAVFDLKCGFWEVLLPESARAWYRFRDASGTLYEMQRLLMGHRAAVELMQLLTSVVAGDPEVVLAKHAAPARVRVWVDGFRYSGVRGDVQSAINLAIENARALNATYKDQVSAPVDAYDFIGVHWDHAKHTVRVADKTLGKLPSSVAAALSARDIEQLVGRLIFTAGVTQTPLADFYFAMKWAKRVCHAINVGLTKIDDSVSVPPSVRQLLDAWIATTSAAHKPRQVRDGEWPILFTDATLTNYGAVLVMPSRQIFVTGAAFDDGTQQHIATREAQAVLYALQDFHHHLQEVPGVELHIDNTTVEGALRRGAAKSDVLAGVISDIHHATILRSKSRPLEFRVTRIASDDNPADGPSRETDLDIALLRTALAKRVPLYRRRGAGSEDPTPLATTTT